MKPPGIGKLVVRVALSTLLLGSWASKTTSAADGSVLSIEVIDPNPALLSADGAVIAADTMEAIDRFAGNHPARIGVVADGLSQLVLRVRASNTVTFSLPVRFGKLRNLGDSGDGTATGAVQSRSASDGTQWAFALYTPPADLSSGMRRTFSISAREGNQSGSASLRLEPPPVLLVHGLWSDSSTWNGLKDFLKDNGHSLCEDISCTVNYGPIQPAPSFDPVAADVENRFAVNHLIERTSNAVHALRQQGIAATQVDVVAHSLGGLIARSRAALTDSARAYRRPDNFQRGDFHKLITVGTPHRGTPVADFLVANRDSRPAFFGGLTVEEYLASVGRPFGRAIEQVQTFSPAIANIGATTNIPSHAIVGVVPKESQTEQSLDYVLGAIGFLTTVDVVLGGNGTHDTIVPRSSQAGGLPRSAVTLARKTVHTDVSGSDVGETESRVVWRRIAQLLRAPVRSKLFGSFTALETNAAAVIPQSFPE